MKKILIIGGAGYVGTSLSNKLLEFNNEITVYDLFIFGNNINKSKKINFINSDVRDIENISKYIDSDTEVIHLACISNDPSFELDPILGKDINFTFFEPLVKICKDKGVKKFIYASSSSVYGIKEHNNVIETDKLEPISDYSKFKAKCEDILIKHSNKEFKSIIIRPATVCGFSPRQRLDLIVNILVNNAIINKKIKIFGGKQLRPNLHIDDMVNSYVYFLNDHIMENNFEIYNVGFENHSVEDLAKITAQTLNNNISFEYIKTNDDRSYHINSDKILKKTLFKPQKTIQDAILDLEMAFKKNLFKDSLNNKMYFNIKITKEFFLAKK